MKKASAATDGNNDDSNVILQGLEDTKGEEYEDAPELDKDGDGDKIDPSVEESDTAAVDAVTAEVEADTTLPSLTQVGINLGQFSVAKV